MEKEGRWVEWNPGPSCGELTTTHRAALPPSHISNRGLNPEWRRIMEQLEESVTSLNVMPLFKAGTDNTYDISICIYDDMYA